MKRIAHSCPMIDAQSAALVGACLRSGQVSTGPGVVRFEKAFAARFGLKGAAAVSSGTSALHLALLALGVGKGDEVVLPTYVCTALLNAVHYVGAKPILVDAREDGNIATQEVKQKLSRRTKAILVPHMFGFPADVEPLLKLGVPIIEDCAQALGAQDAGKHVGTSGRAGIFSFYATKMMATGEGGMVASNDIQLMSRVRDLLSYDHKPEYVVRYNYKMTDMQAVLGLAQLKQLNRFIARRRSLAGIYDQALKGLPCALPQAKPGMAAVYYRYVVKVAGRADQLVDAMKKKGIDAELPLYRPLHRYLRLKGFPVADGLMKDSVSLPIYPALTDAQARCVAKAFASMV